MPTATWNAGAGHNDMNDTSHYDAVWDATYDLVFNGTSTVDATASGAISCNSITITSAYTGAWSISGQTLTCTQGFSDDGVTGSHNYGNGITCNGASATFHSNPGGTLTASSCILTMNGTTGMTIDIDKASSIYKSLILGASAIVTSSGSSASTNFINSSATFTLGNNSSLTLNNSATYFTATATMSLYSIGTGCTLNGTGAVYFWCDVATRTVSLPAITYTGSGSLTIQNSSNVPSGDTFQLTGALNWGTNTVNVTAYNFAGKTLTFDANGNNITCGAFTHGSQNTSTTTINMGSGTHSFTSWIGSTYNSGTINLNLQTSSITCTGAWTYGSAHTIDEGTFSVSFTGTAAQTVTSNGKKFYDVTVNRSTAGTFLFGDAASLHALTVSGTNTQVVSWTGTTVTASGDITIDGTGTHVLGNGITMTGNSATLHLDSTLSSPSASSCVLTMNGTTAMVLDADISFTPKSLTLGNSAVVNNNGGTILALNGSTTLLTLGANATLTLSQQLYLYPTATMSVYSIGAGANIAGNQQMSIEANSNATLTLPALTWTNTGAFRLRNQGAVTVNLSGSFSLGTSQVLLFVNSAANGLTINTSGYSITCGELSWGSAVNGTFTANCGASAFSISSYCATVYNNNGSINFQTSTWSCSGNWAFQSTHTISGTAATTSVTFTNTATITSNGKSFPGKVIINAAGKTITLADDLTIAAGGTLTCTAMTAFAGAKYIIFAGNGYINLSTSVSNRLRTAVAGQTISWSTGANVWNIPAYIHDDWGVAAGADVVWQSFVPSVHYNIAAPAGVVVHNMNVTDCDNSTGTEIDASDWSSTNGGNTHNWKWPPAGASGYMKYW